MFVVTASKKHDRQHHHLAKGGHVAPGLLVASS